MMMKYPFDKRKHEDIRSQLREFNAELLGYLQLINLDVSRDIRTQMVSDSVQVATAIKVVEGLEIGVGQLGASVQQGLQRTEDVANSMAIGFRGLSDEFRDGQERQSATLTQSLDLIIGMLQTRDSTEKNLHSSNTNSPNRNGDVGRPSLGVPIKSVHCDCPGARHGRPAMQHRKWCPYSFTNRNKWVFNLNLVALRRQITAKWRLEYSPLAWTRDWKIYPNLTVRATVTEDAPAFLALNQIRSIPEDAT
ncbi:uncharacterized protein F4822DRAFT_432579 [Hypoxylon trugodes]|uniref:uncharacterized protein n=1 Tax=Hypoxylon trugodes TaxID=326681 RepID=UPI00218F121F|nr:uncharacterized protein F4822DRAFT_432579 [Hypoxylon trugodes]KAI1385724.1 hypothetical protein F4822DRAFT_432579 [Hypoxylon trugodes]